MLYCTYIIMFIGIVRPLCADRTLLYSCHTQCEVREQLLLSVATFLSAHCKHLYAYSVTCTVIVVKYYYTFRAVVSCKQKRILSRS